MSKELDESPHKVSEGPPQRKDSLWLLTLSPSVWAAHFVASYVSAAVWCAKVVGRDGSLLPVRLAVAAYTLVALLIITWTAWRAFKQQAYQSHRSPRALVSEPHDRDTATDRHRFLGFATLLLCGLSFAAVVYGALAVVFIGTCR